MDDVAVPIESAHGADSEWFAELYCVHWDGMVRLAFVMVDDLGVAEDLAQDAFAGLYRSRQAVRDPLAYLRSAVYNACRNHHRHQRVRRSAPTPAATEASFEVDHIIDVIRRLAPRKRALVVLRYYSGLTDTEIAETAGLPVGTVKSTLHRALAELRKELS
jgi:RNA polymerase sigma factor (sigma-70 family)